jgi:nicotinate phosphoribosyltransferase
MPTLALSDQEACWLQITCPFLKPTFIEYLRNYRFDPNEVTVLIRNEQLHLHINGLWGRTILWEVPLMATISELYFKNKNWNYDGQKEKAQNKLKILEDGDCHFADFGTRRRRSFDTQKLVVGEFCKNTNGLFIGTSNPYLAKLFKTKPIGTQSHEWIQGHSILGSLLHANRDAMDAWVKVYRGNLGIALTDTYGTDAFFNDFDLFYAQLFNGVRHDSGDAFKFADKVVAHYKKLRISPSEKTIIFSDNLNVDKAVELKRYCDKIGIKCSFGIGTFFTNDFDGELKPLNMVIKLVGLNGTPVVKLSDDAGKESGDPEAIRVAKWIFYKKSLFD